MTQHAHTQFCKIAMSLGQVYLLHGEVAYGEEVTSGEEVTFFCVIRLLVKRDHSIILIMTKERTPLSRLAAIAQASATSVKHRLSNCKRKVNCGLTPRLYILAYY